MVEESDKNAPQSCPHCGEVHEKGQESCAKAEKEPLKQSVKVGAYTAQLCSFCGQKHRGGRAVCQGTDDEETPVLPGRKHRVADAPPNGSAKDPEDTPLLPGRRPRNRKHGHKQRREDGARSGKQPNAGQNGIKAPGNDTAYSDLTEMSFQPGERSAEMRAFDQAACEREGSAPRLPFDDMEEQPTYLPTVRAQIGACAEDSPEDLVGHTLSDRYALLALIGKGGMSAVYRAKDLKLNKALAVKVLLPHLMGHALSQQRFQLEAQAASSLSHPNLIVTHDFGVTTNGRPYLVMELLDGHSLGEVLKQEKRLPVSRAVPIFIQICDALSHAHGKNVLHRDLKPSNVMISTATGGIDFVRLLDFGIAKVLPQEGAESMGLTRTGEVFGSPNYMSPEQCQGGKIDARADVYSMGCLMYEVLAGQPPLVGENIMDTLLKQLNDPPPEFRAVDPALTVPQQLQLIIFKALAKNPQDRYASAEALGEALRGFQQNATVILFKQIQDRWHVLKLKVRPMKTREKLVWLSAVVFLVLFLTTTTFQLCKYLDITEPGTYPHDQAFMPVTAPVPSAARPQEKIVRQILRSHKDMLREAPTSQRYNRYIETVEASARYYFENGYYKEAAACYGSLMKLAVKNDGHSAVYTRGTIEHLADSNFKLGRFKQAAELYKTLQKSENNDKSRLSDHSIDIRLKEATALYAQGLYSEAAPLFKRSIHQMQNSGLLKTENYAISCARLAECYRLRSLWTDAIEQYERAADTYRLLLQDGNYANAGLSETRSVLIEFYRAYCLYRLDKLEAAAKGYKAVIPKLKKLSGSARELTVPAMAQYADIQWRSGNYFDSLQYRLKARDMQSLLSE